jgi:hypothetical protein
MGEYFKGFESGQKHTLTWVLEYLKETPSAEGLERVIKSIQKRIEQEKAKS